MRLHKTITLSDKITATVKELCMADIRNLAFNLQHCDTPEQEAAVILALSSAGFEIIGAKLDQLTEQQTAELMAAYQLINRAWLNDGKKTKDDAAIDAEQIKRNRKKDFHILSTALCNLISYGHTRCYEYGYSFFKQCLETINDHNKNGSK